MRKRLTMLALVLLFAAGCQKLNYSETAEVKFQGNEPWSKGFTAPAYEQEVKVTVEPELCSVSAYLVTDANLEKVKDFLLAAGQRLGPFLARRRRKVGKRRPGLESCSSCHVSCSPLIGKRLRYNPCKSFTGERTFGSSREIIGNSSKLCKPMHNGPSVTTYSIIARTDLPVRAFKGLRFHG